MINVSPIAPNAADANAIYSLLERMRQAWSRGDAPAYADCFSPDSDYVTYNGIRLRGRKENAEIHAALFRGALKGSKISATVDSLAFLASDVALVHTIGSGARRRKLNSHPTRSIQTLILIKKDGHWRIRSFQNTRIRPVSVWLTRKIAERSRATAS